MIKCKTPKLFYKEYSYKLVICTKFADHFRGNDLGYVREILDHYFSNLKMGRDIYITSWREVQTLTQKDLSQLSTIYQSLSQNSNYRLRAEGGFLVVYSKNRDWLYKLGTNVAAIEWWEPNQDLEPNVLIMGSKMKGWEYKITLGRNVPSDFYEWSLNNSEKLKIGKKLKSYLERNTKYIEGYYFYVRNEKMLNLVCLVLGRGIQRIDKIIIDDQNA